MRSSLLFLCALCTTIANAQTNYALNFNGTSIYVDIGTPLASNASYTKEAWIYPTSNSGSRNIVSSNNTPFWVDIGILKAGQAGNINYVADGTALPLNTWTHVAVTYQASNTTMNLYRNGVLVATNNAVPAYTIENTYIGSFFGSSAYFQGYIDEVRIWNTVRTPAELKQFMLNPPALNATGLVDYYKANENTGTSLINASTNVGGINGTINNSVGWVASPVQFSANALSFDGTDNYVDLGNSSAFHSTGNLTEELMVKSANWNVASEQEIVSNFQGGGYGFYLLSGNLRFEVMASTGSIYRGVSYPVSNLTNNTWYHFAGTFDGRYIRLYVNGTLVGTDDLGSSGNTITYAYPANNMLIGADAGTAATPAGAYFAGQVDELRIWNVARTQAEIQTAKDWEIQAANYPNLVAYYTFNEGNASGTNTGLTTVPDQKNNLNGTLFGFDLTGTASNFITQPSNLVILPLTWLSFTVQQQQHDVLLQWATAQEENSLDFVVQHSTDGVHYMNVAHLASAGTALQNNYSYVHKDVQPGVNYYRIAQRDRDGKSSFSIVRTINIDKDASAIRVKNNPVVNGALQVQVNKPVQLQLFNHSGQMIFSKRYLSGSVSIDLSAYAKGVYLLKANGYSTNVLVQ